MITLHRLVHTDEVLHLNPDLIQSVEACPDTTVRLTTGQCLLVHESPEEVSDAIRAWRAQVLAEAMAVPAAIPALA
jgi:flagellar protein FlbD